MTLEEITWNAVEQALAANRGNQSETARKLGISRSTLWRILNDRMDSKKKRRIFRPICLLSKNKNSLASEKTRPMLYNRATPLSRAAFATAAATAGPIRLSKASGRI